MRLLHVDDSPVVVAVVRLRLRRAGVFGGGRACRASRGCASPSGVDDDLSEFFARFARRPADRPRRPRRARGCGCAATPTPWEALALGDHRAADRHAARDRDPAADDRARFGRRHRAWRDCAVGAADDRPGAGAGRARGVRRCERHARARRCAARRARSPAGASTLARARPTSAAWRRLRAIPEHRHVDGRDARPARARAATTSIPAGDLGYLKLVGRLTTGNPKARRRRGRGARVLRALRALGRPRRPTHLSRAQDCSQPLARQELVGQRRRLVGGCLSRPFVAHPALVVGPVDRFLPAPRLLAVVREEDRQRRLAPPPRWSPRSRSLSASSSASTPASGSSRSSRVPARRSRCRKRRSREAPPSSQRLAPGDEDQLVVGRHAELLHAQDHRVALARAARSTPS